MIADTIKRNLDDVEERITRAAEKSGRRRESVRLIVVSKAQPAEKILTAYECGARYFGENYPEETAEKLPQLAGLKEIEWHMIGHLQSRKAKIVADSFDMLHSLDSLHTAEKLQRLLAEKNRDLPVLIEINTGGETSKSGLSFSDAEKDAVLYAFVEQLRNYPHLKVKGLMTMPPLEANPDQARGYFRKLCSLRADLYKRFPDLEWNELSMGTSADFEVAVEEGATMVRVGSAILGARVYK